MTEQSRSVPGREADARPLAATDVVQALNEVCGEMLGTARHMAQEQKRFGWRPRRDDPSAAAYATANHLVVYALASLKSKLERRS